ncbi:hypothetical protein IX51_05580 [uncultured archaeon]|nr:hypothetical protein IX51_05580 [uncultured archaeon]HKJ96407.1 hypothetical protein [Thermoplasmataceae archaeon]
MPSVRIRKELYEELLEESMDAPERINQIVQGYLSEKKKYESPNSNDPVYGEYFIHGNGD